MDEELQKNMSKRGWGGGLIVAVSLLFRALSHYPVHRLGHCSPANHMRANRDLKPLLDHNQHPADGVTVEHSSHTVDTG